MNYWPLNVYSLALIASALVAGVVAVYAWRRRPATGATALALMMLTVTEWSLAYALELASVTLEAKVFWAQVQYLGIVAVPVLWLCFALQYTGREKWLTRRTLALLALIPIITLLLVWTNEAHGLIWSDVGLNSGGPLPMLDLSYGLWFWVHSVYSYSMLLLGAVLLVQSLIRSPNLYRGQAWALLIGVFAPWLGNALYISGLSPFPSLDLTPFAFTIAGLAAAWALFRFRLLDIVPVARDTVVESMVDGVIVLDTRERIADVNPAACRSLGCTARDVLGQPADRVFAAWPDLAERYRDTTKAQAEISLGEGEARRYYNLRISALHNRWGKATGRLIVLHDETALKRVEMAQYDSSHKLEAQNVELRKLTRAVEQSGSTIVITDLEGNIEYVNPAFSRITGYSREEAIGQNPRILKSGKHPPELYEELWKTISGGQVWQGEMINKKKNGDFYWEAATISPVIDEAGRISHYLAVKEDITARKRVEQALQESEERYRSVTQSAHDAIISADSQGRTVSWNRGAQAIFGYRAEEVLGQSLELLMPAQYTNAHRQALARLRSGGLPRLIGQMVELEGRRQDGEVFPLEMSLSSWQVGGEIFFGAIIRDITSRKRIEEKLRRSEYRFRHLFEAAPDGAIVLDGEGLIVECNASALRLLMRPAKEIVGRHIVEFMAPSSVHVFQDAFPSLKQGKPAEGEIQLTRGDGSLVTVWRKGSPLSDAAGNMSGVLILDRDITRRKQAEEELDSKRRQAETLRAATQALSSTLDLPQVFELILSELQKVVPYDSVSIQQLKDNELEIIGCRGFSNPAEIMGVSFDLTEQDNPNRQVIETRAPLILHDPASDYPEFKSKRHAPARIASWLGVPLLFGDKPIGMIAVDKRESGFYTREHARLAMSFAAQAAIAIENARLLAETQRARETALEASRLKTQLLANVSHDMRTPLGVILGRAEMLQGGVYGPLSEQQHTALTGVMNSTEQALTFVNNLLGQAQIESGKVAFNIKDFAPVELLDVIRSAASALAQAKGLELTGTVAPDMPATLRGDPYWLRQVLANLVSNAVKFTEQGTVDVHIYPVDEGRWAMQVSDTGCGIPPEAQAYIFEPFRQVDGTATRQQHTGSGLGLSIVKELTTLMGGQVELSSEVGQGSTFTVLLPFEPKEEKTS